MPLYLFFDLRKGLFHVLVTPSVPLQCLLYVKVLSMQMPPLQWSPLPSCSRIVQIVFPVYILRLILLVTMPLPRCAWLSAVHEIIKIFICCARPPKKVLLIDDNPKIPGS
jgi:hypothetical protein